MGVWYPDYEITGGLYGSTITPAGDLSGFLERCTTINVSNNNLIAFATRSEYVGHADELAEWPGAFGSSDDRLHNYAAGLTDTDVHYIPFMIFTIENPEGAQYYKQELVIEAAVKAYDRTGTGWTQLVVENLFYRAYRREYATPTATPTVTHTFYTGSLGYPAYYQKGGGAMPYRETFTKFYKFFVSYQEYDQINYLCIGSYQEQEQRFYVSDEPGKFYYYAAFGLNLAVLEQAFGDFKLTETDDPNIPPFPDPDPGQDPDPGPGDREKEYDPIPIPDDPELTAIGAGFLTLYSPSSTTLNLLADEIFSDNIIQIVANYFTSVSDLIAGLSIVPFFVPVSGFAYHKIGLFTSSVSLPLVSSQFITVDCGSVAVNRYFNNFLDQSPNTKILIYLPYIGYQELNTDEVMGNTISVKYKCDILSGACVAFVSIGTGGTSYDATRVIAQFSGNVITQVPTAAQSYDTMVSNAINILTSSVGIAAGAAIGGGIGSGAGMMAQATAGASQISSAVGAQVGLGMAGTAANTIMAMKPTFARNGTPGSTAGYMSVQTPYLIKIVPRDAVATNHRVLKGYPSNYGGALGGLSGYCEVSEIQLTGVDATVDEITEIYSLLKGGVVV